MRTLNYSLSIIILLSIMQQLTKIRSSSLCQVSLCTTCEKVYPTVCIECNSGYTLYANKCIFVNECNDINCQTCLQNNSTLIYECILCNSGLSLNSSGKCSTISSSSSLFGDNLYLLLTIMLPLLFVILIVAIILIVLFCCCKKKPAEEEEEKKAAQQKIEEIVPVAKQSYKKKGGYKLTSQLQHGDQELNIPEDDQINSDVNEAAPIQLGLRDNNMRTSHKDNNQGNHNNQTIEVNGYNANNNNHVNDGNADNIASDGQESRMQIRTELEHVPNME